MISSRWGNQSKNSMHAYLIYIYIYYSSHVSIFVLSCCLFYIVLGCLWVDAVAICFKVNVLACFHGDSLFKLYGAPCIQPASVRAQSLSTRRSSSWPCHAFGATSTDPVGGREYKHQAIHGRCCSSFRVHANSLQHMYIVYI